MRPLLYFALAPLGSSTTHSLPPRPPPPAGATGACAIGVASLRDTEGADHALDLRDRLRARGPCRTVLAVATPDADGMDVVVGGKVNAKVEPDLMWPGAMAGMVGLGAGLGGVTAGAILLATTSEPERDSQGFVDPDARSSSEFGTGFGTALLVGGAVVSALSIGGLVVDTQVAREVSLKARIDADVTVWRGGSAVDTLSLHDDVVVHARHPHGRPEGRETWSAHGPLYRAAMEHVFDHVATRVAEVIEQPPRVAMGAGDDGTEARSPSR